MANSLDVERLEKAIKNVYRDTTGRAEQIDSSTTILENIGFERTDRRDNTHYEFISDQTANARQKYGEKSVSHSAYK